MHTVGLLHPCTSNVGWKTVQVFIEKKVAYNWANIVQTHNVQGSIVVGTTHIGANRTRTSGQ